MTKFKFEYVWLDGYAPEANFRSKTKILSLDTYSGDLDVLPVWSFDGSSTQQAEGSSSDCLLKPVRVYNDSGRSNGYLVLCEVLNADGSPHPSNMRSLFKDDDDLWLGFEQEYVITENGKPLGFPDQGFPEPQGMYYCGVGNGKVTGRQLVENHLDECINSGIEVTGINAEVMIGQWEYQVFGKGAKKACDDLLMSRYLLERVSERFQCTIDFHPKPVSGDWNGSGMHTNFSNGTMRDKGGEDMMKAICESFKVTHDEHIAAYGSDNHMRLTGLHETQHIDTFSYGVSDRGASIRIPVSVPANRWKGYLEDRRPASNADPYKVAAEISATLNKAAKHPAIRKVA